MIQLLNVWQRHMNKHCGRDEREIVELMNGRACMLPCTGETSAGPEIRLWLHELIPYKYHNLFIWLPDEDVEKGKGTNLV